ncbi:hypothetical protein ABZX77_06330 [Streptomyces sp. NPDC004237]|uniref:hypothetical protein n=1 Tax=Streptomyces sp. NPDC004237 TaxID=3154455 RepID=UPI0033BDFBA1
MTDSSFSDDANTASSSARSALGGGQQRGRRRLIVGGVVVVAALLAGGGTWLATRGGGDDSGQGAPVVPTAFGDYKEAKPHDTEWTSIGSESVNTDISKGQVNLTYRGSSGKALIIRVKYEPDAASASNGTSGDFYSIYGTRIDPNQVKTYPAGAVGGEIQCADIIIVRTKLTTCGWHNSTTDVALAPVLNHYEVVSAEAPSDLRTFINALHIVPSK